MTELVVHVPFKGPVTGSQYARGDVVADADEAAVSTHPMLKRKVARRNKQGG